jgi:hypothetical protein
MRPKLVGIFCYCFFLLTSWVGPLFRNFWICQLLLDAHLLWIEGELSSIKMPNTFRHTITLHKEISKHCCISHSHPPPPLLSKICIHRFFKCFKTFPLKCLIYILCSYTTYTRQFYKPQ